ncbi:hypothetical protein BFW38_09630 [Terasakiispira papahanaumokuakeensis]|uniref:2-dehydropantoate 2-reductase n=1 Tax=Terasakiispira papahanaumokuakeensis TaxID=197479 RepID=A0A1E2V9V0_9GAMM|nr:2-dehydropantoate 2-reductase [Terasakiispira papahanaumokuakeensis]ODC03761.1 hypothetical protein BFW38_09630 [Terasakiispira papahanaumokuakeensis]
MSDSSIHILGAGALGTLYACRLSRTGRPLTMLVRPDRLETLAAGIYYREAEQASAKRIFMSIADQVAPASIHHLILATKAQDAAAAIEAWRPALADQANVLMLQNGMGCQAEVAECLSPQQTLVAGSVTEGAYLEGPGHVVHAGVGETVLGHWSGPDIRAVAQWQSLLMVAGLEVSNVAEIRPILWHKLAVNAAINPLTALYECNNGGLASVDLKPKVEALNLETTALFKRLGIPLPAGGLQEMVENVIYATARNQSSMLQDVQAGRPTELRYITGALLRAAKALKVRLPQHEQVYRALAKKLSSPAASQRAYAAPV